MLKKIAVFGLVSAALAFRPAPEPVSVASCYQESYEVQQKPERISESDSDSRGKSNGKGPKKYGGKGHLGGRRCSKGRGFSKGREVSKGRGFSKGKNPRRSDSKRGGRRGGKGCRLSRPIPRPLPIYRP